MRFSLTAVLVIASVALARPTRSVNDPVMNTPASLVQCKPALLTWKANSPPVNLTILSAGDVGAPPLKYLGTHDGNSYIWTVDQPSGKSITIALKM
ncbi:hypothetical protein RhiJN_06849 [Ceratobasidium sp. AG-Ba]|nr:hypothetical protein RhiJN_06849 [Ceratobasidium sp. AG-Ba]QRW07760.1 hypothetical protein RhiLY_06759 [Ceratobasidium sp. AG-Ba]